MIKKIKIQRWIPSLITAVALAGSASLCQAQLSWTFTNSATIAEWTTAEPAGMTATIAPDPVVVNGQSCMQVVMDGVTSTEIDLKANMSSINEAGYLSVSVTMMIDPNSGTEDGATTSYGNLQLALQENGAWPGNAIWYGSIFKPAANSFVTYNFNIKPPYQSANGIFFQCPQVDSGHVYSGPVTNYIASITVNPIPNPWLMIPFTDGSLISGAWDQTKDAPYYNPVTGAGPTSETPAGSWAITIYNTPANQFTGWNQISPPAFDATRYQWIGFDIYLDGPTGGPDVGGFQFFLFDSTWASHWIGAAAFSTSQIGTWVHYNLPCASSGLTSVPAMVFQGARGTDGGTNTYTFHVDNIVLWSPVTIPKIIGLTPGGPGGVQISVDADGTSNPNDQEGITSPSADNSARDFFWINQTPASYSFTLTNFAAPAAAFASTPTAPASVGAGFDAHVYLVNGDSIVAAGQSWGYNQTYSGVPFNAVDYLGLHVQNASVVDTVTYVTNGATITTNNSYTLGGGVVAIIDWKTNAPNFNATNRIVFNFPSMASANGTWSLNFSDNTHGNIVAADGSVNSFTLPDFFNDPNYTANFTPATSLVQFGVFKNGNNANNNLSATFTHVSVSDANGTIYNDSFNGTNLTSEYAWQVAEYYMDAADRAIWIPQNTAWWIKWNATVSGWSVQSTSNLLGAWSNAGVTYTYLDGTGTNTLGAIPAASLPAGNAAFFRLVK